MRSVRRDRRNESFYARRSTSGSYASPLTGAAGRTLLFDTFQSDRTDGKIHFIPELSFRFVAKEYEAWCFQVAAALVSSSQASEYIAPYVVQSGSVIFTHVLSIVVSVAGTNNYTACGAVIIALSPGDTIQAGISSNNAVGNNPSTSCLFSGYRVA